MDLLGLIDISNWFLTLLLLSLSVFLYSKWRHSLFRRYGIPGPPPTPFVGMSLRYDTQGLYITDQELAKEYGDVVGVYVGHKPVVLLSNPETIKEVMVKDFSRTPNRPRDLLPDNGIKNTLLSASDDHWRFLRNTLLPTFSSSKFRLMEPLFEAKYEQLLENLKEKAETGKPVEIKDIFGSYTMDVVASIGFGVEIDTQKNPNSDFVKYAKKYFEMPSSPILALIMMFPKLEPVFDWFGLSPFNRPDVMSFFRSVAEEAVNLRNKDSSKRKDLLQLMLNAHHDTDVNDSEKSQIYEGDPNKWNERSLTMEEVINNSILFMLVSYDTTSNALTFASYNLALHPECQEKLIDEIDNVLGKDRPTVDNIQKLDYLDRVFCESMRIYPSAVRANRRVDQDIIIEGYTIPKGTELSCPIYSIHRDPRFWENPEKFDPERFTPENKAKRHPYVFLPFGHGPRGCIGKRLAHVEMKMAMAYILQHYRFKPCEKTEIPLTLEKGALLKAKYGVYLILEPRN